MRQAGALRQGEKEVFRNEGSTEGDGVEPQPGRSQGNATPNRPARPGKLTKLHSRGRARPAGIYDARMAWIHKTEPDQAEGLLRKIYQDAVARAGKVWQILQLQSANPRQLRASLGLYQSTMHADSVIPARLRETLAVVVSRTNHCLY